MSGLPIQILDPLRNLLMQYTPFLNGIELSTLFGKYEYLAIWKNHLPDITGLPPIACVDITINYLYQRENKQGENGLILFLHALENEVVQTTKDYQELIAYKNELEEYFNNKVEGERTPDEANISESSKVQILNFEYLKLILWHVFGKWSLQVQNSSSHKLKRISLQLHPADGIWVRGQQALDIGTLLPDELSKAAALTLTFDQENGEELRELAVDLSHLVPKMGRPIRSQKSFHFNMR